MKSFSQLCDCVKDQCDPATSGASVYVGLEHLDSGAFILNRHGKPSDVQSAKTRFLKGDVLYGKLRPYLDKAVLAPADGICSTDILVFRPQPDCCAAYLLGLIHTAEFRTHADQTTNGVNHPRTSWHGLAGFSWDVQPERERDKIGAVLWMMQRALQAEEKLLATTRELKQSAVRQLFTHGLRGDPQKETEAGLIPARWQPERLAQLLDIKHGYAFKGSSFATSGKYVLLTPGHFREEGGFRDQKDKTKYYIGQFPPQYLLPKGDMLVAMTEQTSGLLGSVILVPESDKFLHNQRLGLISILDANRLSKLFLYHFFARPEVRSKIAQTGTGSKVRHTSPGRIRDLLIALPDPDEQDEIVSILQTIDRKIAVHERKRAALSDLFQTLLHQLMTAQIRVDKLDIDTSEVKAA